MMQCTPFSNLYPGKHSQRFSSLIFSMLNDIFDGRIENLKKFKNEEGDCPTLVCTDLAARGLDLDVDHVIMFDFPKNSVWVSYCQLHFPLFITDESLLFLWLMWFRLITSIALVELLGWVQKVWWCWFLLVIIFSISYFLQFLVLVGQRALRANALTLSSWTVDQFALQPANGRFNSSAWYLRLARRSLRIHELLKVFHGDRTILFCCEIVRLQATIHRSSSMILRAYLSMGV